MGSFTSMSKVIPAVQDESENKYFLSKKANDLESFLAACRENLKGLPEPIERHWRHHSSRQPPGTRGTTAVEGLRVFQWNILSQTLGTKNDNFVRCPAQALDWKTRRFRILEEVARHDPDVVCLQEVDHFDFFQASLASLNYDGHFVPKPDSPCLYLPDNSGPDGCAIFYKRAKFEAVEVAHRVIEVWCVQSNQVVLSALLRSRRTGLEVMVATTHLKARNGALLSTLRNEQGKDLLRYLEDKARGKPIVCTGDFNAEPAEPVYHTMTFDPNTLLVSAYRAVSDNDEEPGYTTWKIREDGEHIQTLDYIFHSDDHRLKVRSVLDFPEKHQIGEDRLPSLAYASDHFSLVCDFDLHP